MAFNKLYNKYNLTTINERYKFNLLRGIVEIFMFYPFSLRYIPTYTFSILFGSYTFGHNRVKRTEILKGHTTVVQMRTKIQNYVKIVFSILYFCVQD